MSNPMISCLMVTLPLPARFPLLQQSIKAYQRQSLSNRELIVITNAGEPACRQRIRHYIDDLDDPDIRVVEVDGSLNLGTLRNISVVSAKGTIVCQWDDDDLYHPTRLEHQFAALSEAKAEAVYLGEVMQFLADDRILYCTNWKQVEAKAFPGSMMCHRSAKFRYPEDGSDARLGEDLIVARQLNANGRVKIIDGAPYLYVYVTHGHNSWAGEHHRMLIRELAISRGLLKRREAELREGLKPLDFGPGAISVHGNNGPAFTLNETDQHDA